MNNPVRVRASTPNDAMTDALYRATIGLDTNNLELFNSAWLSKKDAVFEMNGDAMRGLDTIHENMFKNIGPLDTTHFLSNVRLQSEDGASTAILTCYALAQHYKPGEGTSPATKGLLSGSMYQVDVVKDDSEDLWKMKKWAMKIIWLDGDMSIVMP